MGGWGPIIIFERATGDCPLFSRLTCVSARFRRGHARRSAQEQTLMQLLSMRYDAQRESKHSVCVK